MPAALSSRDDVIETLIGLFRNDGYDGVSISRISEATGLGRPSLYNYFPGGKDEMLETVVDTVAIWLSERIIAPLEAAGKPRERALRLVRALEESYEGGRAKCLLNVLSLGEGRRFAGSLRPSARRWLRAMARVAEDAGIASERAAALAVEALVKIEGGLVVAQALGKPELFRTTIATLPDVLAPEKRRRAIT